LAAAVRSRSGLKAVVAGGHVSHGIVFEGRQRHLQLGSARVKLIEQLTAQITHMFYDPSSKLSGNPSEIP
jgi:hypothetical protein